MKCSNKNPKQGKNLPKIYCDMDEVLVDFIPYTNSLLKKLGHPKLQNREYWSKNYGEASFWPLLKDDKDFWINLPERKDTKQLWNFISKYKPSILTARTKYHPHVKSGKRKWLQQHLETSKIDDIHIVRRSQKKDYAVDENGNPNLLIDDNINNCMEFIEAGGFAIQHKTARQTIKELKKIGYV